MPLLLSFFVFEGNDNLLKISKTQVNVFGLVEQIPLQLVLAYPLTPSEVHKVKLGDVNTVVLEVFGFQGDSKNAMRPGGTHVHRRGADLPDVIPHHHQVNSLFLIFAVMH